MKRIKASTAILRGYQQVNGRQHFEDYYFGPSAKHPTRVCVLDARNLGATGTAEYCFHSGEPEFEHAFKEAWGFFPSDLNDGGTFDRDEPRMPPLPWEHIYGMARAAGL